MLISFVRVLHTSLKFKATLKILSTTATRSFKLLQIQVSYSVTFFTFLNAAYVSVIKVNFENSTIRLLNCKNTIAQNFNGINTFLTAAQPGNSIKFNFSFSFPWFEKQKLDLGHRAFVVELCTDFFLFWVKYYSNIILEFHNLTKPNWRIKPWEFQWLQEETNFKVSQNNSSKRPLLRIRSCDL